MAISQKHLYNLVEKFPISWRVASSHAIPIIPESSAFAQNGVLPLRGHSRYPAQRPERQYSMRRMDVTSENEICLVSVRNRNIPVHLANGSSENRFGTIPKAIGCAWNTNK